MMKKYLLAAGIIALAAEARAEGPPSDAVDEPRTASARDQERWAIRLYERGEYVKAARVFEALWAEHPEAPHFLLNAAISRRDAGQWSHAVAYQEDYLSRIKFSAESRARVESEFEAAKQQLTPVQVSMQFSPTSVTEVTIIAEWLTPNASRVRPPLKVRGQVVEHGGEARLALEPGEWRLTAHVPGHEIATQVLVVTGVPMATTMSLAPLGMPTTPASQPARARRRWPQGGLSTGVALIALGGSGMVVGAAIAATAGHELRSSTCGGWTQDGSCQMWLRDGVRLRDTGLGVAGAGLGLVVGGLVWMAPTRTMRTGLWAAQVSLGGVLAIASSISIRAVSTPFNDANTGMIADWSQHYVEYADMTPHAIVSNALGLGLGLVTSGTTSLLVQGALGWRRARATRAAVQPGATGVQLSVSGAF